MTLQGSKRKVTYVASYEAIAFLFGTLGFLSFTDSSLERAGALAVFASIFAVSWNFVYNAMFERWEASRITRGRSFSRRVLHAVGFALGYGLAGGMTAVLVSDEPDSKAGGASYWLSSTDQIIVSKSRRILDAEPIRAAADPLPLNPKFPLWTDDFYNLLGILKR